MKTFLEKCRFCRCTYDVDDEEIVLDENNMLWFDEDSVINEIKEGARGCTMYYFGKSERLVGDFVLYARNGNAYLGKVAYQLPTK